MEITVNDIIYLFFIVLAIYAVKMRARKRQEGKYEENKIIWRGKYKQTVKLQLKPIHLFLFFFSPIINTWERGGLVWGEKIQDIFGNQEQSKMKNLYIVLENIQSLYNRTRSSPDTTLT